jgi:hypothetical protein
VWCYAAGYIGSFFFYLDMLAIGSLVPDVSMMWGVNVAEISPVFNLARAGRAARVGTRVARAARLILADVEDSKRGQEGQFAEHGSGSERESTVGKLVLQIISHRTVAIVGVMLLVTHLLFDVGNGFFG